MPKRAEKLIGNGKSPYHKQSLGDRIVSTRSSIWYGEDDGKRVHIYWELAEREVENGGRASHFSVALFC